MGRVMKRGVLQNTESCLQAHYSSLLPARGLNKLWKLRLEELKKVKYFVGYDKGERLKISKKVLKNWGCPFSHIFQFEAALNSGKNS